MVGEVEARHGGGGRSAADLRRGEFARSSKKRLTSLLSILNRRVSSRDGILVVGVGKVDAVTSSSCLELSNAILPD